MLGKKFSRRFLAAALAVGAFTFTPNFYNFDLMPVVHAEENQNTLAEQKLNEGVALAEKGDHEGALKLYNEAIRLNPDYSDAYNNRGITYAFLGQYNKSLSDLNKAIELNPNRAEIYVNRASILFAFQKTGSALDDCNRAIELNPNLAPAYLGRGICYLPLCEFDIFRDKALADFNKAIELEPNYAPAYQMRGELYKLMKQKDKAKVDFAKAKQLGYKKGSSQWIKLGK